MLSSGTSIFGDEHLEQIGRDAGRDLEAYGLTEPPPVQLELQGGQEVLGLVLVHGHVGVAGDPEHLVLDDPHGREQAVEVGGDDLLDQDEPR